MVPRYASRLPYLGAAVHREQTRYSAVTGSDLNFGRAFWTPPMSPRQAYRLEEKQIQRRFGLPGLVSLTDHDDIRAGSLLRILDRFGHVPVSTEWTVPFGPTFFHLGIHNLPVEQATGIMWELARCTANPAAGHLKSLLQLLNQFRDVLVVLNHPLWDEKGIGCESHRETLMFFLNQYGHNFHALELNGLRSWSENQQVIRLARQVDLPVVAGGDRHGCEANALLNLSCSPTMAGFVEEVRFAKRSHIVFMPQYREPLRLRILLTMMDVLADYPENADGRRLWSDRIFYRDQPAGTTIPLTAIWKDGGPALLRRFVAGVRLLRWPGVRSALRLACHERSIALPEGEASL